jgi:hypothetical protein
MTPIASFQPRKLIELPKKDLKWAQMPDGLRTETQKRAPLALFRTKEFQCEPDPA